MAYLTTNQLLEYRPKSSIPRFTYIKESQTCAELTVFLSHSHLDRYFVESFLVLLDSLGIKIYVDWNDKNMPRTTNRETAERIKQKICENTLFVILATPNALDSRWVSWETGIGDQVKGHDAILLIPVADPTGNFRGTEYLQLYARFDFAPMSYRIPVPSRFRIFTPDGHDLCSLEEHLRSKTHHIL